MKGERTDFGLYKSSADPLGAGSKDEREEVFRQGRREKRNGEKVDRHMTGAGEMDHNYLEWTERRGS